MYHNLMYHNKDSFYKYYYHSKKIDSLSLKSKYSFLLEFSENLNKSEKIKTEKEKNRKDNSKCVNYGSRIL